MLDIFNDDAFSVISLTEAINTVPYVPRRIGAMGLFETKHPTSYTVAVERKGETISLIPTKPRRSGETTKKPADRRDLIPFYVPYIPFDDALEAEDLSGIRHYGSEQQLVSASELMTEKLTGLRRSHEATHEYWRVNAIQGRLIDADEDATVLLDVFDALGLTQEEFYFDLEGSGEGIKSVCLEIIQFTEEVLGGQTYDHIHAFVGNTFFQNLVNNEEVRTNYNEQTNYRWSIDQQGTGTMGRGSNTVTFGDITFENYRGKIGSRNFFAADEANFYPVGVEDLFQQHFSPANTMDDINTPGKEVYAMQKMKDWNAGIDIHTESNPLMICKRPKLLVKGYSGASS